MKFEPFALERWITAHELHVEYDIAESGIFPQTVNDLLAFEPENERDQVLRHLLDLRLGYSEATGTLELRSLLAETYTNCGPENILVTTGAIEANFLLFNVLLNPGDHVVAPYPAYQQLYSVPRAIGCDVDLWQVGHENGFRFDLDDLESLVRPQTRLIVVNSPHNPTGAMLSPSETQHVYDIARSAPSRLACLVCALAGWSRRPRSRPNVGPHATMSP
jgi:aspartate/methionine/tyrosine aminotransferase